MVNKKGEIVFSVDARGVGLLRPTPLAVSITISLEDVGEEKAAEAEASQNQTPERARKNTNQWLCLWIVEGIQKITYFVFHNFTFDGLNTRAVFVRPNINSQTIAHGVVTIKRHEKSIVLAAE